jgi:uncharacterized repeat protein (TIGR01451 family)
MKGCKKMAIFTNQAQLRYGNAVANSNVAVGEILEVLAATKTAVRKTYGQNDRVTYVVSIVNSGNTAMTGLTVADDLGAYAFGTDTLVPLTYVADTVRYYSNGILQTTPAVTAGPPLSVSGISVPAGGNVTIVYEAETNAFAPLLAESEITNTVTISGGGITVSDSAMAHMTSAKASLAFFAPYIQEPGRFGHISIVPLCGSYSAGI